MSDSAQPASPVEPSRRERLDRAVRSALGEVEALRAAREEDTKPGTATASEQAQDTPASREQLHRIGCALYEALAGCSPAEAAAAATDATIAESIEDLGGLQMKNRRPAKRRSHGSMAMAAMLDESIGGGGGVPSLKDVGYPVSISLLVDDMIGLGGNPNRSDNGHASGSNKSQLRNSASFHSCTVAFRTVDDVHVELRRMVDSPDRYLLDSTDPSAGTGQLVLPQGRLYGRRTESEELLGVFRRVLCPPAPAKKLPHIHRKNAQGLVLIKGSSGSGKSALVDQLRGPLATIGSDQAENSADPDPAAGGSDGTAVGMLVPCKFDPQVQPMSTIFYAFEEYCRELLATGNDALIASVRADVLRGLGTGRDNLTLVSLIPTLGRLLGIADAAAHQNEEVTAEAFNRIVYSLRAFVRCIAGPDHPVIVYFDDLQWADLSALDLIAMLVTDPETQSLLFLGAYRDNESNQDLEETLGDIAEAKIPITKIHLGELDWAAVNDLVADTLHLSPHLTQSLSTNLHAKTRGNPLFVVQLLKSLYDERLLQYSASSRRWEWDIDAIRAEGIADNAVDLMLAMMRSHSEEVQWVLRVASCLGSRFDERTIKLLYLSIGDDPDGVEVHLRALVDDGLLLPDGDSFKFAHDQIWEASYALTHPEERETMHMEIGRELLRRASAAGEELFEEMLFTIVDQINRGSSLVTDPVERFQVAELNLVAGEKSSAACAFLPASIYLLQGCVFLDDETSWTEHYELSLRLHTALGEVQVAHGDNENAILSLEPVLSQGKTVQDQLRAQHAYMLALIAQGLLNEAVQRGLAVLEKLGESFPSDIDRNTIVEELNKTEDLIRGRSVESILECSLVADENKLAAMKFLTVTARIAYNSNQNFFSLPVLRMINISLTNGLCPESSFAFASAAFLLCNHGHRDLATHCADIALALLKKFDRQYEHVVLLILGLSIHQYRQPMQACLDQIRQAGRLAIASGDVMWGIATIGFIAFNNVWVVERGKTLEDVEAEMRSNIQEWSTYKHFSMDFVMLSFQAVLNLIADTDPSDDPNGDPSVLTGEAMNQDDALAVFEKMNLVTLKREMFHLRLYLSYLFHRYDVASEMYRLYKEVAESGQIFPTVEVVSVTLYSGLLAAAMLREGGDDSVWRPVATDSIATMKDFADKDSEWNFRHRYDLMRAELAAVDGDHEVAITAYKASIENAKKHAFVNDQALATERMGLFFLNKGNLTEASKYLKQASELYETWGSIRKADHVLRKMPRLGSSDL